MKYKSNNITMGQICAEINQVEKKKKHVYNKDLIEKINEVESQSQNYARTTKSYHNNDKSSGPV